MGKNRAPIKGFVYSVKQNLKVRGLGDEMQLISCLSMPETLGSHPSTTHSHIRNTGRPQWENGYSDLLYSGKWPATHVICKPLNIHVPIFQRVLSLHPTALRLGLGYSPNWPGTCYIDQANLELTVTLRFLPFEGCDCKCTPAYLPKNPLFDKESQVQRTRPLKNGS